MLDQLFTYAQDAMTGVIAVLTVVTGPAHRLLRSLAHDLYRRLHLPATFRGLRGLTGGLGRGMSRGLGLTALGAATLTGVGVLAAPPASAAPPVEVPVEDLLVEAWAADGTRSMIPLAQARSTGLLGTPAQGAFGLTTATYDFEDGTGSMALVAGRFTVPDVAAITPVTYTTRIAEPHPATYAYPLEGVSRWDGVIDVDAPGLYAQGSCQVMEGYGDTYTDPRGPVVGRVGVHVAEPVHPLPAEETLPAAFQWDRVVTLDSTTLGCLADLPAGTYPHAGTDATLTVTETSLTLTLPAYEETTVPQWVLPTADGNGLITIDLMTTLVTVDHVTHYSDPAPEPTPEPEPTPVPTPDPEPESESKAEIAETGVDALDAATWAATFLVIGAGALAIAYTRRSLQ